MINNICIGNYSGTNIQTASNCVCIGKNSGLDVIDKDNQIRIGENASAKGKNMVIFDKGRVVLTKKVFESILGKKLSKQVYKIGNKEKVSE